MYNEAIETYMVDAEFIKGGKTNLILEDADGNQTIFALDIKYHNYEITKQ